jgi:NAD(P)-dependent dehydrogenase (short-subunit alcohol dehydrogenase family)
MITAIALLFAASFGGGLFSGGAFNAKAQSDPSTILITGSNRGIGFEFARQYAAKGWKVIATCRNPESADDLKALAADYPNVVIEQLDVLDHNMIDALAVKYEDQPIDILLNNAGINGGVNNQTFGNLKYDVYKRVLATNTVGPLKMSEAFVNHIAASTKKKIVAISSRSGSIATVGGREFFYFYRPSKAALNMTMRLLSKEIADRGIIVGLINPDMVATDMLAGVDPATSSLPIYTPEESVSGMIRVIDNLNPENSGDFLNHTGEEIPW